MGQRWWSESIWVTWLRRCFVSDDKIEVTSPLIFGWGFGSGFLFDGIRQVVTIRLHFLRRTTSREVPFPEASIRLRHERRQDRGGRSWTNYVIELAISDGKLYTVCQAGEHVQIVDIMAALEKLGLQWVTTVRD